MKVLLTGATGYIGSAVTDHLVAAGHQVVALTRGAEPRPGRGWHAQLVGDTADPASLAGVVTPDIEAVVHLAPPSGDVDVDTAVVEALAAPLRGTGRPFVYTSGVWVLGATGEAQEVGSRRRPTRSTWSATARGSSSGCWPRRRRVCGRSWCGPASCTAAAAVSRRSWSTGPAHRGAGVLRAGGCALADRSRGRPGRAVRGRRRAGRGRHHLARRRRVGRPGP
ncbi:NAD-dependent epimerase/dehydratase family protein [Kitasatospora aburaviensis]